jgi:hypothetical protein
MAGGERATSYGVGGKYIVRPKKRGNKAITAASVTWMDKEQVIMKSERPRSVGEKRNEKM